MFHLNCGDFWVAKVSRVKASKVEYSDRVKGVCGGSMGRVPFCFSAGVWRCDSSGTLSERDVITTPLLPTYSQGVPHSPHCALEVWVHRGSRLGLPSFQLSLSVSKPTLSFSFQPFLQSRSFLLESWPAGEP